MGLDLQTCWGGRHRPKAGDVIFVAGQPAPDITVQLITDYGVPKKRAADAPWPCARCPRCKAR